MKKICAIVLLLAVLTVFSGCFASSDDDLEAVSAVNVTTTAGSATTTTVATTVPTTTAPAAISEYPCTAYATDSLNVRRTPNTDYHAVGGLHEGEQVTVIGREGDFYEINFRWTDTDENGQTQSGTTAYVSAQYISINRAAVTTTVPTVANPTVATTTAAQ